MKRHARAPSGSCGERAVSLTVRAVSLTVPARRPWRKQRRWAAAAFAPAALVSGYYATLGPLEYAAYFGRASRETARAIEAPDRLVASLLPPGTAAGDLYYEATDRYVRWWSVLAMRHDEEGEADASAD